MAENALYYPYIHVRDVNWLKGTLLLFGKVRRMVPERDKVLGDDEAIEPYTAHYNRLLEPADIWSDRALHAQEQLADKLERSARDPAFRRKFGVEWRRPALEAGDPGFQIHQEKLHKPLKKALRDNQLAWEPGRAETYADYERYVQVHPRVGQAVMATLAIACAKAEGLDIVADPSSGALHDCLVRRNQDAVYDAWLSDRPKLPEPRRANARELFEYMIALQCDTAELTPRTLKELWPARESLRALIEKLGEHAAKIDPMDLGPRRDQRIRDEVSDILKGWNDDKSSWGAFGREFFGGGLADAGAKLLEKAAEAITAPRAAVAGAGLVGAAATMTAPLFLAGAAAAVGIGLFVHGGKSVAAVRKRGKDSPYRYLSMVEKAGVVFRSDALAARGEAGEASPPS